MKRVNVLGTTYRVVQHSVADDPILINNDGYCDQSVHCCVIDSFADKDINSLKNMAYYKKKVIRHELIHAFLNESGLGNESWATNEEMVDWIAMQFPKMVKAFRKAGAL